MPFFNIIFFSFKYKKLSNKKLTLVVLAVKMLFLTEFKL